MKAKWLKTFTRFLILLNYGCALLLMLLVAICMKIGWFVPLIIAIAVTAAVFVLTFVRIHISTGYWKLIHVKRPPDDKEGIKRALSALVAGILWFIVLGGLYACFIVYITFNKLGLVDWIGLLYLADTLPSAVLAWDEEGGFKGALLSWGKRLLIAVVIIGALLALNMYVIRPWQHNWGATAEEIARAMPGDELVADPDMNATRVVTVHATPAEVWPWIKQIGYKRAGFYSLDSLDNAGIESAREILPEFQDLQAGDRVPIGEGAYMQVISLEPERSLVLQFEKGPWGGNTWVFGLNPQADGTTRLISRLRCRFYKEFPHNLPWMFIDTFEIIMMRSCLLGIKERAEAAATM